jgi:GxxExxY protein
MRENEVATVVVDVAYQLHTTFGPGLLESVYETAMAHELYARGLHVQRQVPIRVYWKDVRLGIGFRADLLVERCVMVEVKSTDAIAPVHRKQLLTYLKLGDCHLGLLINFNVELIKDGISRIVNRLPA